MARSLPVENLLPQNVWSIISTTCSNLLKKPNWELLVAVDHNQLQTMALETIDPIDWVHPPPLWAVLPELLVHSINRCSLSSTGNRSFNFSMRDNHLAYAATQGIKGRSPADTSPDGLTVARANRSPGVATPRSSG